MGSIGMPEILLIFLVVLLVFGAKRIPEIARGLGKGIREFKDATREITSEINLDDRRIHAPKQPAQKTAPRQDTYQPAEPAPKTQESAAMPEADEPAKE